jgi:hypothetical protein
VAVVTSLTTQPDLALKREPPKMKMRAKPVVAVAPKPKQVAAEGDASVTFKAFPSSLRDLGERVTFRINAGVELDSAPASGETLRGGAALPPGFTDSRPWIVGDAMIATKDIVLPSLAGYFLTSFQADASDSLATRTAVIDPSDQGQHLAIKAGYAEYGRDSKADNADQHFWARAGRQFRLDGGAMFAYFDGVTVGYRMKGIELSAFAGQRVVLYIDTPNGLTFGTTAAVDLKQTNDIPVRLAADFLGLRIDDLVANEQDQLRWMLNLTGSSELLGKKLKLEARARIIDDGQGSDAMGNSTAPDPVTGQLVPASGVQVGRLGIRARYEASSSVLVIADVEQRFGGDLAYDLAAPSAVDVVDVSRKLGVGLAQAIDALRVGARVDYRLRDTEVMVFGSAEIPQGTVLTVDQRGFIEGGLALGLAPLPGVYANAQYTLRQYQSADDLDGTNAMGSDFGSTSGSGLDRLQEIAVDGWMRSPKGNKWRFGLGAFYRIYDMVDPYRTVSTDGRGGARADLQWWFTRQVRANVAAEVAQPSPTLQRDLSTMTSVRAAMEARW